MRKELRLPAKTTHKIETVVGVLDYHNKKTAKMETVDMISIKRSMMPLFIGEEGKTKQAVIEKTGVRDLKIGERCPLNNLDCTIHILGPAENVATAKAVLLKMKTDREREVKQLRLRRMEAELKVMEENVVKYRERLEALRKTIPTD